MKWLKKRHPHCLPLVTALVITLLGTPAVANPDQIGGIRTDAAFWAPMTFMVGPPTYDNRQRVYATGDIELGTAKVFADFIASHGFPAGSVIAFHSPGGSPIEGVKIGEIIRKMNFDTVVAQSSTNTGNGLLDRIASDKAGVCASSCSIAYLGGVNRRMVAGSLYGVHDIFLTKNLRGVDLLDLGQKFAGMLDDYFNRMGVRSGLLSTMTEQNGGKGEIAWLSLEQMAKLQITTETGTSWQKSVAHSDQSATKSQTNWQLANSSAGFVLEGINTEANNISGNFEKVAFMCVGAPQHVDLRAYYMPEALIGDGRHTTQMSPQSFVALVTGYSVSVLQDKNGPVDSSFHTVPVSTSLVIEPAHVSGAHYVGATIAMTPDLTELVAEGTTLTFNFSRFAGSGGVSVDLSSGRSQIVQFIKNCGGQQH